MRTVLLAFVMLLALASTASAEPVAIFVQNQTPRSEIAQSVVELLQQHLAKDAKYRLSGDKFEPAIQVLVYGTHAYQDLHALSVNYVIYNGSCFAFYSSSLIPTTLKQAPNEASAIAGFLSRNLAELQPLLH